MTGKREASDRVEGLLTPRNLGGILTGAWWLFRTSFGAAIVPFIVSSIAVQVATLGFAAAFGAATPTASTFFLFLLVDTLAFEVVMTLVVAAASVIMLKRTAGASAAWRDAARRIRPRATALLASAFYSTIVAMFGTMLLLPLGPLFFPIARIAFIGPPVLVQVIAYERRSLQDAVPRTRALWRHQLMRVVVYMVSFAFAAVLLFYVVLSLILGIVDALVADTVNYVVGQVLGGVVLGTLLPLFAALSTSLYLDLRARFDDGFDVEELRADGDDDQ